MSEEKEKDLKPCPFCGGKAELFVDETDYDITYTVECSSCGSSSRCDDMKEDAIKHWNTRVNDGGAVC